MAGILQDLRIVELENNKRALFMRRFISDMFKVRWMIDFENIKRDHITRRFIPGMLTVGWMVDFENRL